MEYLIDSNSLFDAHNKWYRPKVFKSVWEFMAQNDCIKMSILVYNEIQYPDSLVNWTQKKFKNEQITPNTEIIDVYNDVMEWVTNSTRWDDAGFSQWQLPDKADPWLVATAKVNHQIIVTFDGNGRAASPDLNSYSKREPKINSVAEHFNVKTITMYELLDQLQLSL